MKAELIKDVEVVKKSIGFLFDFNDEVKQLAFIRDYYDIFAFFVFFKTFESRNPNYV